MGKFILEECKRVIIKKKVPIIVIFMLITGLGLVNTLKLKTYEHQLKEQNAKIYSLESGRDSQNSDEKKLLFTASIERIKRSVDNIKLRLDIIKNYDKSKLDGQIKELRKENNTKNEDKINQLEYCKKYNIEKNNLIPKGTTAALENLRIMSRLFILIFIFIIILSDMVSGEYRPNTIKNLIIRPVSRKKIIISKFIVSMILNIGIIIASFVIFLLEGGICLGFSDLKLPFGVGAHYSLDKSTSLNVIAYQMKYITGSQSFIPNWQAILLMLLIVILASMAITSTILFISTICKNSLTSVICNIILMVGSAIFYTLGYRGNVFLEAKYGMIVKFLPLPYLLDSNELLNGNIFEYINYNVNIIFVSIICLAWILSMIILSANIFAKRDFD